MQSLERSGATDLGWELLKRVASGDGDAFTELMREHQDRVLAVCQRMLNDRAQAEDATQEVFLKAYHKAGSLKPKGQVYTWLYRVAVNHCLNRLRRRKIVRFIPLMAQDEGEDSVRRDLEPVDRAADPEKTLAARERWRRTERRIGRLPANQRVVLILAKFEGMSYREIAEVLEITEGAVESRLFRAMQTLRAAQEN